jgi:DNA-binding response OmpR family regulator
MTKALVVEYNSKVVDHLSKLLLAESFSSVVISEENQLAQVISGKDQFSVIVLDRLLGSFDTKSKIAEMKRKWPEASILVLSAINTPIERAEVLQLGADDYMGKPFLSQELIARVRALVRRSSSPEKYRQLGSTILNISQRSLSFEDRSELLPAKEFLVLKLLTDDIGKVFSRVEILESVWGSSSEVETNVVESVITSLRRRLANLGSKVEIKNMRNAGYWIED